MECHQRLTSREKILIHYDNGNKDKFNENDSCFYCDDYDQLTTTTAEDIQFLSTFGKTFPVDTNFELMFAKRFHC